MSADLTALLNEWPYEPGRLNVRAITGADGEARVQIRLDLGIVQMNAEGRPDGQRPHDAESLLEHHDGQIDETPDGEEPPPLTPEDCAALRDEAMQYHHRAVALMALENFGGVLRDATRNMRAIEMMAARAEMDSDRTSLDHLRPQLMMMRARALAELAVRENEPKAALIALEDGIEALKALYTETGEPDLFESSAEARLLRGMRDALTPKLPLSEKSELKARLAQAVQQENYELAAILRDELKRLEG